MNTRGMAGRMWVGFVDFWMKERPVAGIFRRVLAFGFDAAILAGIGFLISLPLKSVFHDMGDNAFVVGFVIALLYFGILDSRIGRGHSPGKYLINMRVVDRNMQLLSLPRSIARFLVFGIPCFLYGRIEPMSSPLMDSLASLIVFGGLGASAFLLVFNLRTRQVLHDLLTGSFVLDEHATHPPLERPRSLHLVVASGILFVALLQPFLPQAPTPEQPPRLAGLAASLETTDGVRDATVIQRAYEIERKSVEYLVMNLELDTPKVEDENFARRALAIANRELEDHEGRDAIERVYITLGWGFDIGIWQGRAIKGYDYPVSKLDNPPPLEEPEPEPDEEGEGKNADSSDQGEDDTDNDP